MKIPIITNVLERLTILETKMDAVMETVAEWLELSNSYKKWQTIQNYNQKKLKKQK